MMNEEMGPQEPPENARWERDLDLIAGHIAGLGRLMYQVDNMGDMAPAEEAKAAFARLSVRHLRLVAWLHASEGYPVEIHDAEVRKQALAAFEEDWEPVVEEIAAVA